MQDWRVVDATQSRSFKKEEEALKNFLKEEGVMVADARVKSNTNGSH